MTLQQLEYIVAVDKHRHFVKAAEESGVTQSTLSTLIRKLEDELDTIIFDRNSHPVKPTDVGAKIIAQAKVVLYNSQQLKAIPEEEKMIAEGDVNIGIIPTVSTNVVAKLLKQVNQDSPGIHLHIFEMHTCDIIEEIKNATLDMAILATPLNNEDILEIPIYYEKLVLYVSPSEELYTKRQIDCSEIPTEKLWTLKDGNCLKNQVLNICGISSCGLNQKFEAGSIATLLNIIDENGGFTIIPELYVEQLREDQKANIRSLATPVPVREISIIIRADYMREKILNEIVSAVKKIIPDNMIDSRLKKFAIKI